MTADDQIRWDQRYREGAYASRRHPAAFLEERWPHVDMARADAKALDLACGAGRNSLFLAHHGLHVEAVDISPQALLRGREMAMDQGIEPSRIAWIQQDLDNALPTAMTRYDLILIIRYLDLALVQAARHLLNPGGHLLCEVHLQTDEEVSGPRSASFRAAPGELKEAVSGLDILLYQEGRIQDPDGETACVARLHARRP